MLKCVFPDLKHKPVLTKQIKNFEPDTGISSSATLIEYKFLSRAEDVGPLADELLADTRGITLRNGIASCTLSMRPVGLRNRTNGTN